MNEYTKCVLRIILFYAFIFTFCYISFPVMKKALIISNYWPRIESNINSKKDMWVIDNISLSAAKSNDKVVIFPVKLLWVTRAHNLANPILGIQYFDTIKPTYSIHDTIKFFK